MIKASEYSERREKLINMMEPQSAMVLFSGVEKCKSADEDYPFEVARNFYYLTGIDQPDSMLLLINVDGERKEFLFCRFFKNSKDNFLKFFLSRLPCHIQTKHHLFIKQF